MLPFDRHTRTHPLRGLRGRDGFTLVELLATMMILGLIVGVVTISWDAVVPSTRLTADVRALSSRLHGARSDAIARNAEFWIVYDLEQHEYWIQAPYDEEGRVRQTAEGGRQLFRTALREGVQFEEITIDGRVYADNIGGFPYVRFDPLGASNDHTIVLRQPRFNAFYTIEVLGLTGQIRFHDGVYRPEPPRDVDFR